MCSSIILKKMPIMGNEPWNNFSEDGEVNSETRRVKLGQRFINKARIRKCCQKSVKLYAIEQ